MALVKSLDLLQEIGLRNHSLCAFKRLPASEGAFEDYPDAVHPDLRDALRRKGFERLYSHQRRAWEKLREGRDIVVVTPTASGKTLCYNLPVLDAVLKDPSTRAAYVFPTKALAQDQRAELDETIRLLGREVNIF
ncbi:MAG: DEAD/DEAH box helicase, partial [Candidatus Aminicenantes bacterium]|nr:DEAD/DEAH box helicase [Candidatus Aminicenantes bacterium]